MKSHETKATACLAGIFALRMLGLFMILPVFSHYATSLKGNTAFLIGVTLGIYGLTQACLQIPFGLLSDRIGRKPLIVIGLLIFILGSIVAALSTSIYGVIVGRALQGAGAIGSVTIAFIADLTYEENRTKAMAMLGLTISLAFAFAIILGPFLASQIGIGGIFWLTAVLGFGGIWLLMLVPTPSHMGVQRDAEPIPRLFKSILRNPELLRLDFGIFVLHAVLTAMFIVMPLLLTDLLGIPQAKQGLLYLPVLLVAFILMVPCIIIAEKKRNIKQVFIGAIVVLCLSQIMLLFADNVLIVVVLSLLAFFTAFTILEASLPSLISKIAPVGSKGTAIGIYSTSQFSGIFVGGILGGWLFGMHRNHGIFILCLFMLLIWLIIALSMKKPQYLATYNIKIGTITAIRKQQLQQVLLAQPGVAEVLIDEDVTYLKLDSKLADKQQLKLLAQQYAADQ